MISRSISTRRLRGASSPNIVASRRATMSQVAADCTHGFVPRFSPVASGRCAPQILSIPPTSILRAAAAELAGKSAIALSISFFADARFA